MDEEDYWPSLDDLKKWPKTRLQDWLSADGLPKSGNKGVLSKRVYLSLGADSTSDYSDEESSHQQSLAPITSLTTGWIIPQLETLPSIRDKDVENFFIHRKLICT